MSVFKKIDTQDFYLTDYVARKSWRLLGTEVGESGVEVLYGESGSTLPLYPSSNRDPGVVWRSVKSNYHGTGSGSKETPFQWDSCLQPARLLGSEICVLNFPQNLIGINLEPGTVEIGPSPNTSYFLTSYNTPPSEIVTNYDESTYSIQLTYPGGIPFSDFILFKRGDLELAVDDFETTETGIDLTITGTDYNIIFQIMEVIEEVEYYNAVELSGPLRYVEDEYARDGYIDESYLQYMLWDDGKGHLINPETLEIKGDIVYNTGQLFIKDLDLVEFYKYNQNRFELKWKSNLPIYTLNVNCRIRNTEMNYTLNPSAGELSTGEIHENITGEEFSPYLTAVGLYNDRNELLMVGKMNRPVQKSKDMDMVFKISIDI